MISILKKYNQITIMALSALLLTLFAYMTPPGLFAAELPEWQMFHLFPRVSHIPLPPIFIGKRK